MKNYTDTLIDEFLVEETEVLSEGNTDYADAAFANGTITQKDIDECQFIYQLAQRIPGYKINGNKVSDSTRAKIIAAGTKYNFDMSKYKGSSTVPPKGGGLSDEEWFVMLPPGQERNNDVSKLRLLRRGWKYECAICHNPGIWENKPLVLQLDHIDGHNNNNVLENLRFLCPNCHAQTETYARPIRKYKINTPAIDDLEN